MADPMNIRQIAYAVFLLTRTDNPLLLSSCEAGTARRGGALGRLRPSHSLEGKSRVRRHRRLPPLRRRVGHYLSTLFG